MREKFCLHEVFFVLTTCRERFCLPGTTDRKWKRIKETMKQMLKKTILFLLITCFMLCLSGCGSEKGIEGEWVLVKEVLSDGTTLKEADLKEKGIGESYKIEGDKVQYKLDAFMASKPIEIEFDLEKSGDKEYIFKKSTLVFATVTLDKNTFSYYTGEGTERTKMVFKRKD